MRLEYREQRIIYRIIVESAREYSKKEKGV